MALSGSLSKKFEMLSSLVVVLFGEQLMMNIVIRKMSSLYCLCIFGLHYWGGAKIDKLFRYAKPFAVFVSKILLFCGM